MSKRSIVDTKGRHLLAAWLLGAEEKRGAQSALAERLGVTSSLVSQWVSGAARPGEVYREALAGIAEIDASEWDTADEAERRKKALAAVAANGTDG